MRIKQKYIHNVFVSFVNTHRPTFLYIHHYNIINTLTVYSGWASIKLVSHQEITVWQLLATLTTAFLNDCLTNLSKYLEIVVYND